MLYKYLKGMSKYFILEPDHEFKFEAFKRFAKHPITRMECVSGTNKDDVIT